MKRISGSLQNLFPGMESMKTAVCKSHWAPSIYKPNTSTPSSGGVEPDCNVNSIELIKGMEPDCNVNSIELLRGVEPDCNVNGIESLREVEPDCNVNSIELLRGVEPDCNVNSIESLRIYIHIYPCWIYISFFFIYIEFIYPYPCWIFISLPMLTLYYSFLLFSQNKSKKHSNVYPVY